MLRVITESLECFPTHRRGPDAACLYLKAPLNHLFRPDPPTEGYRFRWHCGLQAPSETLYFERHDSERIAAPR